MSDIASITGLDYAEEDMHTPAQEDPPEVEVIDGVPTIVGSSAEPEAKPKRHRRTKAEMAAVRAAKGLAPIGADHEEDDDMDMGATIEQLRSLNRPTPAEEIDYRPANFKDPTGKQLAYIDARYVMDTLDDGVGPQNWSADFESLSGSAVRCTITVWMRGERSVRKTDVGVPSTIEPEKGAHSDAFKRAAVHFGIARDLYDERLSEPASPIPGTPITVAPTIQQVAAAAAAPAMQDPAQPALVAAAPVSVAPTGLVEGVGAWACPIHGTSRIQPAGISRAGRPYPAFWVCGTPGCRQSGGNA